MNDLNAAGIVAMAMPALNVKPIPFDIPLSQYEAMLITSPHALSADLPDLPVIAVGQETARLAHAAGLYVMHTGEGGIRDIDLYRYGSLLYPCALEPTFIPDNATPWHVYESVPNPDFCIDDTVETVCVFSKKAAKHILPHCREHHTVIALSQAIAELFEGQSPRNLVVCDAPRYDMMKHILMT